MAEGVVKNHFTPLDTECCVKGVVFNRLNALVGDPVRLWTRCSMLLASPTIRHRAISVLCRLSREQLNSSGHICVHLNVC
jgi:hypothetical protein